MNSTLKTSWNREILKKKERPFFVPAPPPPPPAATSLSLRFRVVRIDASMKEADAALPGDKVGDRRPKSAARENNKKKVAQRKKNRAKPGKT